MTRTVLVKIVAGVIVITGSLFYLIPRAEDILQPQSPIDSGDRGLIIFATQGGNPDLALTARQYYGADGATSVLFYFTAPDISHGHGGNARSIEVKVAFVGSAFKPGTVRCGSTAPWSISWSQVAQGTRRAIEVDAISKRNSAIGYENEGADVIEKLQKATVLEYQITMWPLIDGSRLYDSSKDDEGNIFAEECTFQQESAWRLEQGKSFESSPERTLLPFQLNWTSIDEATDFHRSFYPSIVVDRGEGITLTEAYPQAKTYDDTWVYENDVDWSMKLGQVGNLAYTDQPVYLFGARSASDRQAVIMLWSGVLLGLIATIMIRTASLLIDAMFRHRSMSKEESQR